MCVDANDNELAWLESIHLFVEVLGKSLVLSPLPKPASEDRIYTIQRKE